MLISPSVNPVPAKPARYRPVARIGVGVAVTVALLLSMLVEKTHELSGTVITEKVVFSVLTGLVFVAPLPAAIAFVVASLIAPLLGPVYVGPAYIGSLVAVFLIAAKGNRVWAVLLTLFFVVYTNALDIRDTIEKGEFIPAVLITLAIYGAALVGGLWVDRYRAHAEAVGRAAAEASIQTRINIARELHDTLAYTVTVMVMKAEAMRLRGDLTPADEEDINFITATGRAASTDLRHLLAALRGSDTQIDTTIPVVEVLQRQRSMLSTFRFRSRVLATGDLDALPRSTSATLAQVLTETTNNMVKHGDNAGEVQIVVDAETPGRVEAVLVNEIPGTPSGDTRPDRVAEEPAPPDSATARSAAPKLGLLGARELVERTGGRLSASRTANRWVVHLVLPWDATDG